MQRKTRSQAWMPKSAVRTVVLPALPDLTADRQLEYLRRQCHREFREALSPFWAWRMSHR